MCLSTDNIPHMKNIRLGPNALIDPDTPDNVKSRTAYNGKKQVLAVSTRVALFYYILLTLFSSRTNSQKTAVLFTTTMIHSSRLSIFGMV